MVTLVGERNFCGNFEPAWLNVEFAECTAAFQLLTWDLLSGEFWGSSGAHQWDDKQCIVFHWSFPSLFWSSCGKECVGHWFHWSWGAGGAQGCTGGGFLVVLWELMDLGESQLERSRGPLSQLPPRCWRGALCRTEVLDILWLSLCCVWDQSICLGLKWLGFASRSCTGD